MKLLGFLFIGTLSTAALVNLTVNPLRVTPSPLSLHSLEPYREISGQMRTGKAGMLMSRNDWKVLLSGSSRIGHGLDPLHLGWGGEPVANLGLSGGYLTESEAMIRFALDRCRPRCVILGIDPGDLTSDYDAKATSDFSSSPLASDGERMNRSLRYVFGIPMMEDSFKVLRNAFKGRQARYSPHGFLLAGDGAEKDQLGFLTGELANTRVQKAEGELRQPKVHLLDSLLNDLRRRDIQVILFFQPLHPLGIVHEGQTLLGKAPFEEERRLLCAVAARHGADFWDFNMCHPIDREQLPADASARMEHWDDLAHFTSAVGGRMLARMMVWPAAHGDDYGAKVTPENIEQHLERVVGNFTSYLSNEGRKDLALKSSLIARRMKSLE